MHIGKAEITSLEAIGKLGVIESEEMEDSRMKVVHMHLVLGDVETEFIRLADGNARLEAATCGPHGECLWVMITTHVIAACWV